MVNYESASFQELYEALQEGDRMVREHLFDQFERAREGYNQFERDREGYNQQEEVVRALVKKVINLTQEGGKAPELDRFMTILALGCQTLRIQPYDILQNMITSLDPSNRLVSRIGALFVGITLLAGLETEAEINSKPRTLLNR